MVAEETGRAQPFSPTAEALAQLDWPTLCARLASACAGSEAQEFWQSPVFLQERREVEEALRLTGEALDLLARDQAPPLQGLYDLRPHLLRLERDASLEAAELLEVAATLGCIRRTRSFLRDRLDMAPGLGQLAEQLSAARELEESIEEAFDDAGNLADNASPTLGTLRRRVVSLHEGITGRMEQLVRELDGQGHLQDSWFTLRGERYVVPLRAGARGHVRGIVHDVSGSGQTLFVEPEEMVELNNRLRIAQIEVQEEERRILRELSGWVAEQLPTIGPSLQILVRLDRIFAGATLGVDLRATVPTLTDGEILLQRARHPLLQLKGGRVVANDLQLGGEGGVLVISGPNTGGKTVTLKMVGLFALMVRVGLPVPAEPGARFPLFSNVFCDIGDQQSIARSLSTFSAHLTNLASFLPRVERSSLVLLDELVVGTDPREGEALAAAVLRWLADRGARTLVTTHYEALKALALQDPRFVNASVGFDPTTFGPTYQLHLGQPGRSSPLDIASRLGLPEGILQLARTLLPQEKLHLEEAIRSLEQTRDRLAHEQEELARARQAAQQEQREAAAEKEAWSRRRKALVQEGHEETVAALRAARAELAAAVRTLQRGADHGGVTIVRRRVDTIADRVAELARQATSPPEERAQPPLTIETATPGLPVELTGRGLRGTIEGTDAERRQATVRAGSLRLTVPLAELRPQARPPALLGAPGRGSKPPGGPGPRAPAPPPVTGRRRMPAPEGDEPQLLVQPGLSLDLRGLRVEEALGEIERFMDKGLAQRHPYVFLIHGHGTGALKVAVREYLESSPYVRRWRPGGRTEGGDGVSVIWLDQA
ncbi:MAG: Smr/MutS family protein [Myxococcota bacterium]|jgi:DNA mismatch repair protein MutS2|nr:Smr/MutS family protein [Myxococcota bacterium]